VLGAGALYLLYALATTWPLLTDPGGSIFGEIGGDHTGSIAYYRELVEHRIFPFAPGRNPDFDAPFGQEIPWALNIATAPSTTLMLLMAYVFGSVAAHALFTWIGFVASGVAMFVLARRVTGSPLAALVAGFGFAFYPFAINKGLGHLGYMHGWVLVLAAWRTLELVDQPTRRNGVWAGAALVLAMWWTPYFILFAAVLVGVLGAAVLLAAILRGDARRTLVALAIMAGMTVLFMVFLVVLQLAGGSGGGGEINRPFEHLVIFSARPHEFLLPDRNSLLFGGLTEGYLTEHLHGSNFSESSLYLGISLIVLALVGVVVTVRRALRARREAAGDLRVVAAVGSAVTVIAAAAFSLPPQVTVGGVLINFPMWYVSQVTGVYRAVSRFVVVIELGVCVLAAIGLAALLSRLRARPAGLVAAVTLVVVALDLWARPPAPVNALTPAPSFYQQAAKLAPGILVEYPLFAAEFPDGTAIFWQQAHGHPILQGYNSGESENRKIELADPLDSETAGDLAAYGVRWVLLRPYPGLPAKLGTGFRLEYEDPTGVKLYAVTAPPSRTQVDALSGFGIVEGETNHHSRWLTRPEGRLLVRGDCDPCRGELRLTASSFQVPRTVVFRDDAGRELGRSVVASTATTVRVPLSFRRQMVVHVTTDPGPRPAPFPDTRELAVIVNEPRFVLTP
jgi:hypothetical protein